MRRRVVLYAFFHQLKPWRFENRVLFALGLLFFVPSHESELKLLLCTSKTEDFAEAAD